VFVFNLSTGIARRLLSFGLISVLRRSANSYPVYYMTGCKKRPHRRTTMIRSNLPRASRFVTVGIACAAVFGLICATPSVARAESASLAGSWSGSGSISFASGSKEKARCRAHYAKTGETSYEMSATCATASAKVDQSATLTRTGANSYAGSFFNEQYNTGGSIRVTVSGGSQSVRLSGEAGNAFFSLRKL